MYHPLLTTRYLTSRVIPLIAVAAVALCVALVIVVISVMTGFLDMVRDSGKTLIGDVVISYPIAGIPYYDRIIDRLTKNSSVAAAAPVVDAFGLLQMPYPDGPNKQTETVQFWGVDSRFAQVTSFADTLHWKVPTDNQFLLLFADAFRAYAKSLPSLLSDDQKRALFKELRFPEDSINRATDSQWDAISSFLATDPVLAKDTLSAEQWATFLQSDPRMVTHAAFADAIDSNSSMVLKTLGASDRLNVFERWLREQRPSYSDSEVRDALKNPPGDAEWPAFLHRIVFSMDAIRPSLSDQAWQALVTFDARLAQPNALVSQGLSLTRNGKPAADLGMHVSEANIRNHEGGYDVAASDHWWMPTWSVTLTTLPVHGGTLSSEPESYIFPVANEFMSGVYLIDSKRIMIPLDVAQHMLHLDKSTRVDPGDPTIELGEDPARATMILVRAKPGVTADELRDIVADEYEKLDAEISSERASSSTYVASLPPYFGTRNGGGGGGVAIQTWAQQQAQFIGPVENERNLMKTLFSIIYLVCAALVLSIFWSIVQEKTRDIGILRSIGAARSGVMWVFLRYGFWIGVLGGVAGNGLAYIVVRNINPIHTALGSPPVFLAVFAAFPCLIALFWIFYMAKWKGLLFLAITITVIAAVGGSAWLTSLLLNFNISGFIEENPEGPIGISIFIILLCALMFGEVIPQKGLIPSLVGTLCFIVAAVVSGVIIRGHMYGGFVMWNPEVYYFSVIPNSVDWRTAWGTMFLALAFSLLGASIPAAKAADTDPVQALRYE
ncbi:MAG TPA: FtsX-like permease family protein [Phycisphaerales bacterium]|nr:FtsX-like permease family protein [Phycisphaerales bacterium]